MASIPGLEKLEKDGWEIVGFDYVSQEEWFIDSEGRIVQWSFLGRSIEKKIIVRKVQHPNPAKQSWTPMFGDVVTLKRESSNPKKLIVRSNKNDGLILCVSENETRVVWAYFADLVFVRRPVPASFGPETVQAIAKAVADELRGSWANRLTEPVKRHPLADGLVGVWVPAKQAEAPWTPKVGDWVKVTKPVDCAPANKIWWVEAMDRFHGQVLQVTSVWAQNSSAKLDDQKHWDFDFDWLALAEDPRGQPTPTKQYREPTPDDLKNGPIECEVGDNHEKRTLVYVFDNEPGRARFVAVDEAHPNCIGRWIDCRIEVK